jgi:hypothetical protein
VGTARLGLAQVFPSLVPTGSLADLVLSPLGNMIPVLIPVSFGFAILRARLWEIDLIINCTLVYGALTVMPSLVYVGLIIGLQALVRKVTGQTSGVAVVVSTLAVAALFQSLRRRTQEVIDLHFYRSKYNVARTLETFGITLRSKTDVDELRTQLLAIIDETMQPAHVSLWLAPLQRTGNAAKGEIVTVTPEVPSALPR